MGGTQLTATPAAVNPYYEIWDPENSPEITKQVAIDPLYFKKIGANYYPFNYVLPSGEMLSWSSRWGCIFDPMRVRPETIDKGKCNVRNYG